MKQCTICKKEKSFKDYHKNSKMKDGHFNQCKDCRRELKRVYHQTEKGKKLRRNWRKSWRKKNPKKRAAHKILENALKSGKIIKPNKCEHCGNTKSLHGHHEDYSLPLLVIWLCVDCHKRVHNGELE